MITEACGAVHCGNATVLRSLGKKKQHGTAQQRCGAVLHRKSHFSSALYTAQHKRPELIKAWHEILGVFDC